MDDPDDTMTDADFKALIAKSDKETLWWAMYRLLGALHSARACDPDCIGKQDNRGGLYAVVHMTADHWGPQVPGMPNPAAVARSIAQDISYHELTFWAERNGLRITGDEFI